MARISEYSPANLPLTGSEVFVLNQHGVTHNSTISGIAESTPIQNYLNNKESYLGLPAEDGSVLKSTVSGIRYWSPVYDSLEYFSEEYSHDGTLSLYDFVYQTGLNKKVVKVTDNNSINPVIGVVTDIISSNAVQVTFAGTFDINDTLVEGRKVFVSVSGTLTTDVPDKNYIQVLGHAITNNRLHFKPELTRVKRL